MSRPSSGLDRPMDRPPPIHTHDATHNNTHNPDRSAYLHAHAEARALAVVVEVPLQDVLHAARLAHHVHPGAEDALTNGGGVGVGDGKGGWWACLYGYVYIWWAAGLYGNM